MPDEPTKLELVPKADPKSVFDDLTSLRRASKLTVQRKAVLVNVTVGKPANNVYFRCSRNPDLILDDATVLFDRDDSDRACYFVVPHMRAHPRLKPRLRQVSLVLTVIWPSGGFLIWPVPKIVGEKVFPAWKSAGKASDLAREQWVQMVWEGSDYQIETADPEAGIDHEPIWPQQDFGELLKLGFDGKTIDNEDHPYVRRLRGLLD